MDDPNPRLNDTGPDTTSLYAWLSRDNDGQEGTIMVPDGGGGVLPLVTTSLTRARRCRPFAEVAARERGFPARLVRFDRAATLDVVGG